MKSNNNKAWSRRITSGVSAIAILLMFNQCVQEYEEVQEVEVAPIQMPNDSIHSVGDVGSGSNEEEADIVPEEEKETGATEVARTAASVGVQNFEQIDASFSALTGMSRFNNNNIRDAYNANFLGLPNNNSVKSFNAANTMAVFKLASTYCSELSNNMTARNNFYSGVLDLTRAPSQVLANSAQKQAFVDGMMSRVWGSGVEDGDPMNQARSELLLLVDELLADENMGSTNTTRIVAVGICAAMLSSPQVIYL